MKTKTFKVVSLFIATFMLLFMPLLLTSCDDEETITSAEVSNFALEIAKDYTSKHKVTKFADTTFFYSARLESSYYDKVEYKENPTDTETIQKDMAGLMTAETTTNISVKNMKDDLYAIQINEIKEETNAHYDANNENMALTYITTYKKTINNVYYYAENVNNEYKYRVVIESTQYQDEIIKASEKTYYTYDNKDAFIYDVYNILTTLTEEIVQDYLFQIFQKPFYYNEFACTDIKKDKNHYTINILKSSFKYDEKMLKELSYDLSLKLYKDKTMSLKYIETYKTLKESEIGIKNCNFDYGSTINLPSDLSNYTETANHIDYELKLSELDTYK